MLHVIYTCKRAFNEIGSDRIALSPANGKSLTEEYIYGFSLSQSLSLRSRFGEISKMKTGVG